MVDTTYQLSTVVGATSDVNLWCYVHGIDQQGHATTSADTTRPTAPRGDLASSGRARALAC